LFTLTGENREVRHQLSKDVYLSTLVYKYIVHTNQPKIITFLVIF
jgi:Zn-dependent M16 (insulinase) family peptidase